MSLDLENVLAVIQHTRDVGPVFDRLRRLNLDASPVHAVRVVYEGLADLDSRHIGGVDELKQYVLTAEENYLAEALHEVAADFANLESATIWNNRQWEGALHTADACSADLIVKYAHADEHTLFLQAPDDWNLLRHSKMPVLMVSPTTWKEKPVFAAAIDVHDRSHGALNRRILEVADALRERVDGSLHIVSAVPSVGVLMDNAPLDQDRLRRELDAEAREFIDEICATQGLTDYVPHVVAGDAGQQLAEFSREHGIDLLVLGTKARTGLGGFVLGNTSESILSRATVDVLTVPVAPGTD